MTTRSLPHLGLVCLVLATGLVASTAAGQSCPDGMVLVPAGPFTMGADEGGEPDERPAHTVHLSAFCIDKHEVLNRDYAACVRAGKCKKPRELGERFAAAERPVVGVRWYDAERYCAYRGKRLLTEAQWEKAARGEQSTTYPWGDEAPDDTRGCFGWREGRPCKPGSYPAGDSPYGVSDMAGGVWEWIADVYDAGYYPRSAANDPQGGTCAESLRFFRELHRKKVKGFTGSNPIPTECERVLRGGAWNYAARGLRSSNRVHHAPNFRINVAGIRCGADPISAAPTPESASPE